MQEDRHAAQEVAVIKDDRAMTDGRIRWVPHNVNPTDALTKLEGAHREPLLKLMWTSRLCLCDEEKTLDLHQDLQLQHGYFPRKRNT